MTRALEAAAAGVRQAIHRAARGLVDRDALVEMVALACVAGEHILVIGPPGTAKSQAVRAVANQLEAGYFEYLLGRFTEPTEIFGPIDLRKLREGRVEVETAGMLPEAEFGFLDEVFQGSTAILNTLLGLLNERKYRRGHTAMPCPLRVCVGASNALPIDPALAAFADRFLVHVFVEPVPDPQLEALLEGGWQLGADEATSEGPAARIDDLDALAEAAPRCDMTAARPVLAQAVRVLRSADIALSDRRVVKCQRLIAAAAVLDGRDRATAADLWPLIYALPTEDAQRSGREVLRDLLADSANAAAPVAAEAASAGPTARAARLVADGRALLDAPAPDDAGWRLRLEGLLREIDAGFSPESTPEALTGVREAAGAALAPRADGE